MMLLICITFRDILDDPAQGANDDDLIQEITLRTDSIDSSQCEACLKMKISQLQNSCETPLLHDLKRGSDKTFMGSDINNCNKFRINKYSPVEVTFEHETTNAWKGKLAIVRTNSNSFVCPIDKWLDTSGKQGNNDNIPTLTCSCTTSGKRLMVKFQTIQ